MVEVAPVFLEAVCRWQGIGVVAQVVLAELAGGVAEIDQELGERRRTGPQIGRAAGQLRRDHARAQRIHSGEEGIAPGGAALHGNIVHEDCALLPDAVDVGRFADHQAAMVDARLHPADVIAHDEQDVGLGLLLGLRNARCAGQRCQQERSSKRADPSASEGCWIHLSSPWHQQVCRSVKSPCAQLADHGVRGWRLASGYATKS